MSDSTASGNGTTVRGARGVDDPPSHLAPGTGSESGFEFLADPLSHDRDGVHALFEEPDFFYQSAHPRLLSGEEIDELVSRRAYGLVRGSALIGLYEASAIDDDPKQGHYLLHLRLTARTPTEVCVEAYHAAIRRTRLIHDVVRMSAWVGGHDLRGLEILRACDLVEEGALNNEIMHDGRLYPECSFALVWTPEEVAG